MDANRRDLIVKLRAIADGLEAGTISGAAIVYVTQQGGVEYQYQGSELGPIATLLLGLRRVPYMIESGLRKSHSYEVNREQIESVLQRVALDDPRNASEGAPMPTPGVRVIATDTASGGTGGNDGGGSVSG